MFSTCASLICVVVLAICDASELARGWGDNLKWTDLDNGLEQAAEANKPLMLVIHKSWCGACKALKPKFAESNEIAELSENFVMVNTLDDEEPKGAKYTPDGGYIPRVLFLTPEGEVLETVYNEAGSDKYKFYYHDPSDIAKSMKNALASMGKESETKEEL